MAHTYSIQLKEKLGHTIKLVKAGPKSGYPEDLEINLGFELWARFRNHMFRSISPIGLNNLDEEQTFAVEPYGLYISEYCDSKLVGIVRDAFGTVYMGCIH